MQRKRKYLILAVEDDPDDQFLIKEALIPFQGTFDLKFFGEGQQLIDYLNNPAQRKLPSLILLDLNLPGKSGQEVLAEVKSNPTFEKIPVVIFSVAEQSEAVGYKRYNLCDFVRKPATYPEFFEVVRDIVRKWVFVEEE